MWTAQRWSASAHHKPFVEAAQGRRAAGWRDDLCLRHTAITRALLAGVPVRLVASCFDTSVAMIEKTYPGGAASRRRCCAPRAN